MCFVLSRTSCSRTSSNYQKEKESVYGGLLNTYCPILIQLWYLKISDIIDNSMLAITKVCQSHISNYSRALIYFSYKSGVIHLFSVIVQWVFLPNFNVRTTWRSNWNSQNRTAVLTGDFDWWEVPTSMNLWWLSR